MTESEWLACADPDRMLEHLIGIVTVEQLAEFVRACWRHVQVGGAVLESVADEVERLGEWDAVRYAAESAVQAARRARSFAAERRQQAAILRRVVGNPARPSPGPMSATVLRLAEALSAGDDCAFALHDALLETGRADLARHFQTGTPHSPDCAWLRHIREDRSAGGPPTGCASE